jgi:glycerate dehydrogenase
MRIVIVDSFPADQGDETIWSLLTDLGSVSIYPRTRPEDVVDHCREADAVLTNKVVLDGATLAALPQLRYIGVTATGTNVVDTAAARQRGIAVTNVPAYSTQSVAQLVFALILHFTSAVAAHDRAVKQGEWAACRDFSFLAQPVTELAGKTLAIVGAGAIGGTVARIAEAFGMRTIAAAVPGSSSPGRVPLPEALAQADIVSLHCPLTPQTNRLVNAEFLAAMKRDAILINTGRGGLVDEGALLAALESGRLRGVGLDVLTQEPPPAGHLLLDPAAPWAGRLAVTPHIGWATAEARARLVHETIENVKAFARGERRNRVD